MGKCSFWLDLPDSKAQNTHVADLFSKWGRSIWKQKSTIGFRLIRFQFIITANQRKCLGIYFYYIEFFLNCSMHKHSAEGENKKGENSSFLLYPYPLLHRKDEQDGVCGHSCSYRGFLLYSRCQPKIKTFALQDIKWKTLTGPDDITAPSRGTRTNLKPKENCKMTFL